MNKTIGQQKNGFTIIEVVLVLAIAGLIFLIVFPAVPALQRSQRDTQRKQDVSRMMSQLQAYASNKNGNYPPTATVNSTFKDGYMVKDGQSFSDPSKDSSTPYAINGIGYPGNTYTGPADLGNIDYIVGAKCDDSGAKVLTQSSGNRNVAAVIKVEQGDAYCQDNQ